MDNKSDRQAQELINLAHFFAVTGCQIIIDRNDVGPFPRKGIQIYRQSRNKRFPFTGLHFCNIPAVQYNAAQELYIKMAHAEDTPRCFTHDCKRFRQKIIKRFSFLQAFFKFKSLSLEGRIAKRRHLWFQIIDMAHDRPHFF